MKWRPISEAPRDGTVILLATPEPPPKTWTVEAGCWRWWDKDSDYPWLTFDPLAIEHLNGLRDGKYGPTHYSLLPDPPEEA